MPSKSYGLPDENINMIVAFRKLLDEQGYTGSLDMRGDQYVFNTDLPLEGEVKRFYDQWWADVMPPAPVGEWGKM